MSAPLANLLAAVNAVMSEVGYVQKSQRNDFHRYNYAGEGDLLEVLRPSMVKHGLILIPSFDGDAPRIDEHGNTHIVMSYTLAHKSGEVWPHPIRMAGSGNDKNSKGGVGDKGLYKSITGANKYLLFKLFQIETGDDPEQHSLPAPKAEPEQPKEKRIPVKLDPGHDPAIYSRGGDIVAALADAFDQATTMQLVHWLENENKKVITKLVMKDEGLPLRDAIGGAYKRLREQAA